MSYDSQLEEMYPRPPKNRNEGWEAIVIAIEVIFFIIVFVGSILLFT